MLIAVNNDGKAILTRYRLVAVASPVADIFPGFFQSKLLNIRDTSSTDYTTLTMNNWTQIT